MDPRFELQGYCAMNRTSHHLASLLLSGLLATSGALLAEPHTGAGHLSPAQDQIIAWVPRSQAPTAGVAQALVHLHLDRALRDAEAEHCAGAWQLATRPHKSRPLSVSAPHALGAAPAWHYRLSQAEFTLDHCPGVDALEFQRSVSRHLPAWVLIQPAHQSNLLQQGKAIARENILPTPTWLAGL